MRSTSISLLLLLSSVSALAGFGSREPIKWGKISAREFSVLPLGSDSAAPAIVLCDFGNIQISNRTFYSRHTRIKILNEEGLRYASVEIPYQTKNRHDDFVELRAHTLVMENGKIVTYKLPAGQIEVIKINEQWSKKKFTFPNVKPGVIIEFQYTVASLDFEKLDTWYFQREIPTLWSELRFEIPSPFVYLVTFENSRLLAPDEEMLFGQKLQWLYETRSRKRHNDLVNSNYLLYATPENRYKVWAVNNMKKKIVMKNLPGLSAVSGDQPLASYYPQARFDLFESSGNLPRSFKPLVLTTHKDYETRGEWALMRDRTALTGYVHFRLNTWSEFNEDLLEHDRFGMYLMKNSGGTRLTDSIIGQSRNRTEQLEAIYNYVQKTFQWNGEFSVYASQNFNDFIRHRKGSSADINLILVNLLRQAGIMAYPLLIRTADRGLPEKMFPVKGQFNHVIVYAELDGTEILLDAISGSTDLNKLHKLDIGTQGWIVREDNPGWVDIFSPRSREEDEDVPVFRL
jgi:hypothetical protein